MEEIAIGVMNVVFITKYSTKEKEAIINILEDKDVADKGNAICNYLDIEKRHNRSAINAFLNSHFTN